MGRILQSKQLSYAAETEAKYTVSERMEGVLESNHQQLLHLNVGVGWDLVSLEKEA